jgi:hypothetical protein
VVSSGDLLDGAEYWVNISRGGKWLGAGFMLTSCWVLTAHHCLGNPMPGAEDVEVEFQSGAVLTGRVHRRSPAADLALIDIPRSDSGPVIPHHGRPSAGEAWRNPYKPSSTHVLLSGIIDAVHSSYECEDGDFIEVMQLACRQDLGDYAGYSGSPIESAGSDGESRLSGVLIEQYYRHYPLNGMPRPASKVLFAVTLSEVMKRFDCFHMGPLIDLLPSSSGGDAVVSRDGGGGPFAGSSAQDDAESNIAVADAKITALDKWQKSGLLDEQRITALKVRVIERHLLGCDRESSDERSA